jgi:ferrous iron transport protein A
MTNPQTTTRLLPLDQLPQGAQGTFIEIRGGRTLLNRLLSLGFTPGSTIRMQQNPPLGPLLVEVRGTFVALGRGEAGKIIIERGEA